MLIILTNDENINIKHRSVQKFLIFLYFKYLYNSKNNINAIPLIIINNENPILKLNLAFNQEPWVFIIGLKYKNSGIISK